ncbi:MAG: four helix bundle protein [Parvicella sp.]|jgi:four helix bundle protein
MKHNFRELNIWKQSIQLVTELYVLVSKLPAEEKFGLKSQMCRSAVSISSNIAEGSGRTTNKDFNRFLDIGLASSYELETQLIISSNLYKIEVSGLIDKINELQKMIAGFKRTLVL